ncbi:MAG: B12-binding domain-containing radical SAM protein [Thermoanaerobaculales bacterium]|nr:B12-binding domain-containing radical SAM protein [Thermoanaerobaculales bacterium]
MQELTDPSPISPNTGSSPASGRPSVLLVNPPITHAQRTGPLGPIIKNLYFNSPPLGIAYIAGLLESKGMRVRLMDAAVEGFSPEETVEKIIHWQPDILGLTSTSNFFCNAIELGQAVKKVLPGITTVLGGPHVSSQAEQAMARPCFDFACIGEGEYTTLDLVETLANERDPGSVEGIAFRRNGRIHQTARRPLIATLDDLPPPARHLLPLDKYVAQPNDGPYLPKMAMISSRGCPFKCIFCDHGTYGNTYRSFSAPRIVDEMEELVTRYGARDIAFVDSLFMISDKRVRGIVTEILDRCIKVHWTCTIRANIASRELLALMKEAGCWRVRIGVESGNQQVLDFIKKEVTKEEIREVAGAAADLGLHPKAFFMVGHPTETEQTIQDSIDFACSLPLTDITVQINTPLPGAPQFEIYQRYGESVSDNLEDYTFWQPVFIPRGLSREKIEEFFRKFYLSFYLRPIIAWRHLTMLRRPSDIQRYARALGLLFQRFIRTRVDAVFHTSKQA